MKIVYISNASIPSSAAASIHIMKMCQAFSFLGNEVHLIVPISDAGKQPDINKSFEYYGVKKCFNIIYVPVPKIKNANRFWGHDAVQSSFKYAPHLIYTRHLPSSLFALECGFPVIFEEHRFRKSCKNQGLTKKHRWKLYFKNFIFLNYLNIKGLLANSNSESTQIDIYKSLILKDVFAREVEFFKKIINNPRLLRFVVISHALGNDFCKLSPALANKVLVAPDGADLPNKDLFPPVKLKNRYGKLNVGYCGNLYPGKGMEIIEKLVSLCPWATFHIVGGFGDDLYMWQARLKNYKNIHFYGYVPPKHTAAYIAHFDVCLLPNQKDVVTYAKKKNINIGSYTSPLKMFEYMASGKPIVASDLPILKEVLKDKYNALLCPYNDPKAWANALQKLLENPILRHSLGQQALDDFIKHYTWQSRAEYILRGLEIDSNNMFNKLQVIS